MTKDALDALASLPLLARELRAAGVVRLKVEGVELELLPELTAPVVPAGAASAGDLPPLTASPLDDAMTFGSRGVPRFPRPEREP